MYEAELSTVKRLGASEAGVLIVQGNLASTYDALGRKEEASSMYRDVYFGTLRLYGEEHTETTTDAYNYAVTLAELKRYAEVKALLHKAVPVARRILGENHEVTLKMRWTYAMARLQGHTRDREAVTTLEDVARITRRVFGGAHPMAVGVDRALRNSRSVLAARETRQEP